MDRLTPLLSLYALPPRFSSLFFLLFGNSNQTGITGDKRYRNGLITFPGGVPLYKNGKLVGAVGVSGDGVDQDEFVAFGGAKGFEPGAEAVKLGNKAHSVDPYP